MKIAIRSNYGVARIYPADDEAHLALQIIQWRKEMPKTLPINKLELFLRLGIRFEIVECDESVDARYLASQIDSMQSG